MKQPTKTPKATKQSARPDAVAFLDDLFGHEADWEPWVERARVNRDVAHAIHDLRTARGLTQQQLAELVDTQQSVIARLEDADYEGHSLTMLSRIAAALHQRVKVEFVPLADLPPRKQDAPRPSSRGRAGVHVEEMSGLRVAASAATPGRRKSAARTTGRATEPRDGRSTGAKSKSQTTENRAGVGRSGTAARTGRTASAR